MTTQRGEWGSRIGFILAAAGSAIGLGAIWKFPYMAGANGGGAFLLLYLAAVLGIGLAMMLAELAVGRATHLDAVGAFRTLGGKKWSVFGYLSLIAAFLILCFYCVVGGWTVAYLAKAITGNLLTPRDAAEFSAQFKGFISDPVASLIYFAVFMLLTIGILVGGVKDGIERISKVLMPLLFLLMLAMIIRSVTLPGAGEGIRFFLVPKLGDITARAFIDALGFACFSLSLGFAGMLTYGSYMRKDEDMAKSALWVVALQTMATLLAGFMVLPAVFAFGMEPGAGPGLSFITLPAVFKAMPGGSVFAVIFFALLLIAALTSSVSIVEPMVAWCIDQHGMGRKAAAALVAVTAFIVGVPAAWSFGGGKVWTFFGKTPFELMDYMTSNLMLPVNVLATCLLMGWGAHAVFRRELFQRMQARTGGRAAAPWWVAPVEWTCKIIAPLVIAAILVGSLDQ